MRRVLGLSAAPCRFQQIEFRRLDLRPPIRRPGCHSGGSPETFTFAEPEKYRGYSEPIARVARSAAFGSANSPVGSAERSYLRRLSIESRMRSAVVSTESFSLIMLEELAMVL
jgi:hypothetical protein